MLTEFGKGQESPLLLYTDSQNARQTVLNKLNSARTRHIDIKYKWVIEKVEEGKFQLEHIRIDEMIVKGMIKPLGKEKHAQFVKMLSLCVK